MKKETKKELLKDIAVDPTIQASIEENAKRSYQNYKNAVEKEKRKERLLSILIGAFVIIATTILLVINYGLTSEAKNDCLKRGYSENYCISKL